MVRGAPSAGESDGQMTQELDASQSEHMAIVRSAKDAAEQAIRSARRANIIAVAAVIVAVIAIAVSTIPLFVDQTDPLSASIRTFLDSI
jgi:hypothetical protein